MGQVIAGPSWLRAFVFLAALLTAFSSLAQQVPDQTRLQGYWEGDGSSDKCWITISGNVLNFYAREDFWFETTFTLNTQTDPPQLLATIVKDHGNTDVGSVVLAIYKIEGDTLTLVVSKGTDVPPPKAFASDPDSVLGRYELVRVTHPREEVQE